MATSPAPPRPPAGLARSRRDLWRALLDQYEVDQHELTILREACRTADLCDQLQAILAAEEIMGESSQGARVHPAAAELRQQRIAFARLLTALRIPQGDGGRARRRGAYQLGCASCDAASV